MYACICRAVTEETVTAAVEDGATTVEAVGEETRAGTGCGGCHDTIEEIITSCATCPIAGLVA